MSFGPDRLIADLIALGYTVEKKDLGNGVIFAIVKDYLIEVGRFHDRVIDLGLQASADFPRTVHSAIHVRATSQLYEKSDSVQNVRNITDSALGAEWRYWSKNFNWTTERSARRLMSQVNSIFLNA
jgi:hypothetical protein